MGVDVISVVTTPAASYDLVLLDDVKQYQGVPDSDTSNDAFYSTQITRASAAIQSYCNRQFAAETITDSIFPQRDSYPFQVPGGVNKLQLSKWPIIAVASVTLLNDPTNPQVLVAGSDYVVKPQPGQLIRLSPMTSYPCLWEPVNVVVAYQGGYEAIPADIQEACLRMISKATQGRGRDPMLKSISEQGVSREYWIDMGKDGYFPPEVTELLDAYRVPVAR